MSVCPCSCIFGADFEQTCIAEIEILGVKSLVFHALIDVKFYDFYTCPKFTALQLAQITSFQEFSKSENFFY